VPWLLEDVKSHAHDLSVFADIGTEAPAVSETAKAFSITLTRRGDRTELQFLGDSDSITEIVEDRSLKHASFRALLASDRYGALRDWAARQNAFLERELPIESQTIDVKGRLNSGLEPIGQQQIDDILHQPQGGGSTRVLLIDGPAGIGKTHFILGLAARRAANYATERRPLILHVQSRGRTLSYIYDLIAYSLQRLRIETTYDQVPILAKHGLITIAIDGFDELADPDGYDLAWSQVSELIVNLRGSGSIILAGRETFIGRDRVIKDIASIRDEDEIFVLTLQPPTKGEAINWLSEQSWNEEQISAVERFLEPNSLALRPFFLTTLSDPAIAASLTQSSSTSVLAILMEAMIDREVKKFGEAVEEALTLEQRRIFIRNFMGEVARDMAESSTVSISDATLSWLVEVALPVETSDVVTRLLKGRSQVLAFLTNDDRPGYRRFFHDKFFEYFLSSVIIDTIGRAEVSKSISRNILGSSLLDTFGTVIFTGTGPTKARAFLIQALQLTREYPPIDRTRRNLGALLVASLPLADLVEEFEIRSVDIDEARATGTSGRSKLSEVIISQLDCRGADLSNIDLENCVILTLIGDSGTLLPASFPTPTRVQDIGLSSGVVTKPADARQWIDSHLMDPPEKELGLVPEHLRDHGALRLLAKACRMRQYWLRGGGDDIPASRVLENEYWPLLEETLGKHNLLRVEYRPASGTNAKFIHIRQPESLLAEDLSDPDIVGFFGDLVKRL
jgi:hypothetical protein